MHSVTGSLDMEQTILGIHADFGTFLRLCYFFVCMGQLGPCDMGLFRDIAVYATRVLETGGMVRLGSSGHGASILDLSSQTDLAKCTTEFETHADLGVPRHSSYTATRNVEILNVRFGCCPTKTALCNRHARLGSTG